MEFSYVFDKAGEMRFHKYKIEIGGNQSKIIQTVKVLKDLMVGADSEIFGFFYIEIIIKVLLKVYFSRDSSQETLKQIMEAIEYLAA